MTKVVVDPGICGFIAIIEAVALSDRAARVTVTSECEKAVEAELGFALPKDVSFQIQRES